MTGEPTAQKPLLLWPGVAAVVLQWLVRFGVPIVMPEALPYCIIGELVGAFAIVVWWVFFSRAPRFERWGFIGLTILVMAATSRVIHKSIATGMMGFLFVIYA